MPDTETTTEPTTEPTTEHVEDTPTPEAAAVTDTTPEPEPPAPKPDLGEGGKKAIEAEREARRQAERQLREARAALKEYEDRDKSELELLRERAESAEKAAAAAELAVQAAEQHALRTRVAATKGVPAERLTGTTEDELLASADELIAWRDQSYKAAALPPKRPESAGRSGASGAEITNADPKAIAAEALRRHRQTA